MALGLRFWLVWGLILGGPLALFCLLLAEPSLDRTFGTFSFHFWVVSGVTLAAAVAYCVTVGLTRSLHETRLVFLGLAFMSIAGIFAAHGLLTPGHIEDETAPPRKCFLPGKGLRRLQPRLPDLLLPQSPPRQRCRH